MYVEDAWDGKNMEVTIARVPRYGYARDGHALQLEAEQRIVELTLNLDQIRQLRDVCDAYLAEQERLRLTPETKIAAAGGAATALR